MHRVSRVRRAGLVVLLVLSVGVASRPETASAKGILGGLFKGAFRGIGKGIGKGIGRGIGKGIGRGIGKGVGRGIARGIHKGAPQAAVKVTVPARVQAARGPARWSWTGRHRPGAMNPAAVASTGPVHELASRTPHVRPRWGHRPRAVGVARRGYARAIVYRRALNLSLDTDLVYDCALASRDWQAADDDAALDPARLALVEIPTDPADADLFLDGELLTGGGPTRRTVVTPGTHVLEVARDGFRPTVVTFVVEPHRVYVLPIRLQSITAPPASGSPFADGERSARLELVVAEEGTEVLVDGQSWGIAEAGQVGTLHLPPGRHVVRLVRPGAPEQRLEVDLLPGRTQRLEPSKAR